MALVIQPGMDAETLVINRLASASRPSAGNPCRSNTGQGYDHVGADRLKVLHLSQICVRLVCIYFCVSTIRCWVGFFPQSGFEVLPAI